ncbi:hypothetical protein [Streptomyces sp. cmx-4-9]|uniref:hypothetical protein n=1 Tax=Streptomyces sp. cmx-4-9 TaxID=2790941 RepID=UPI00397FA7F0
MRTIPFRTAAPVLSVSVLAALLLSGCGQAGGLVGAGPTATASGPVHLWPTRQPATVPPADPGGAPPEYVKGIPPVHHQDVHEVEPLALVQAEVRTHPDAYSGTDGMPGETAAAILACGKEGQDPAKCPVLTPYYRDLTGNGREELIVGVELPDRMMSVRVYTADPDGRLNRIMATTQTVVAVELAGQDVILRAPSGNNGYELITAWSWDGKQRTMLPTREQIVRVPAGSRPTPGTSEAPGTSDAPGTSEAPGTPGTSGASGTPGTPGTPGAS